MSPGNVVSCFVHALGCCKVPVLISAVRRSGPRPVNGPNCDDRGAASTLGRGAAIAFHVHVATCGFNSATFSVCPPRGGTRAQYCARVT